METIIRKGALCLLILASCSAISPVRTDCQRTVKKERTEQRIERNRQNAVDALIASAERWMDVRELTGNNDHPMITRAMRLCGLDGNKGYAWCAAAQAEIHDHAGLTSPHSARVVDWFAQNVVWMPGFSEIPQSIDKSGMVGGLYYRRLGRLGHIFLIIGEDKNNYYTLEGNTNVAGSREGDGFYKKVRSKKSVAALADYCLLGKAFSNKYDKFLPHEN